MVHGATRAGLRQRTLRNQMQETAFLAQIVLTMRFLVLILGCMRRSHRRGTALASVGPYPMPRTTIAYPLPYAPYYHSLCEPRCSVLPWPMLLSYCPTLSCYPTAPGMAYAATDMAYAATS
eukprot:309679-Rhodomonas_salina.1